MARLRTRQGGREGGREGSSSTAGQRKKTSAKTKGEKEGGKGVPGVEELFASFGFEDGEEYTLKEYEEMAVEWRRNYFKKVREGAVG